MRLYDVESNAQDLVDSGQVNNKPINILIGEPINTFGNRERNLSSKFGGIKV